MQHTRRRNLLRAFAGVLLAPAWPAARGAQAGVLPLHAPEPMAQLHVTAAGDLLGVSPSGLLWQFADGKWARHGEGLDPGAPIASGHGRIAGRSKWGTLWLLEEGRVAHSRGPVLAPHAGLRILPLGIIAVAQEGNGEAFAVRIEPMAANGWAESARSADPVLPDARPLQAQLDGPGNADDGHIVVFAGPDGQRYRHGALGDQTEPTRILYLERHGLEVLRRLTLSPPHVFEDIAPRPVAWRGGGALLTVRSGPFGAQLAVVAADSERRDALRLAALGAPLGTANHWMAPTTDGRRLLAVHTPHIGGVLHEYRADGDQLTSRALASGVSNHALGQRELNLAAWAGSLLLIPTQDRRHLRILDPARGWAERSRVALHSAVVASRALHLDQRPGCALLLEGGSVAWVAVAP